MRNSGWSSNSDANIDQAVAVAVCDVTVPPISVVLPVAEAFRANPNITSICLRSFVAGNKMNNSVNGSTEMLKKAMRSRTKSWQEEAQETDIEVPGTPKTPRTSTTPGINYFIQDSFYIRTRGKNTASRGNLLSNEERGIGAGYVLSLAVLCNKKSNHRNSSINVVLLLPGFIRS
ncbi:hypothetical protein J6590_079320 [Homalodisca vitripennis]|nr:hypothetical protein J6590_079320 [Homalodisca vitripennis]